MRRQNELETAFLTTIESNPLITSENLFRHVNKQGHYSKATLRSAMRVLRESDQIENVSANPAVSSWLSTKMAL